MKTIAFLFALITTCVSTISYAQFNNYQVSDNTAYYPEEVTIALNPSEPQYLAAGSNLNYAYRSSDGGRTWLQQKVTSSFGVWGDPVMLFDKNGNLYFVHLSNPTDGYWIDRIVIQKSTDNGATFNDGTHTGVIEPHNQDKAWIAVDLTNSAYRNNLYVTWTEFDSYGSSASEDSSRILFSKSTDFAETWSEPKQINDVNGNCIDSDETVEGAVPAVGTNGEIYVAWSGPLGIMFDKSLDGGETWGRDIFVAEQPGGWDYNVSGIYRANGLPITACDTSSNSPYRGTVYVLWTDTRNGETDPDVFLAKSTDAGESWSDAIRVNNDNSGRPQFFAWLAIDQTNGNLYASFYDRRNTAEDYTEYWLARSSDGGETWTNYCVSDGEFPVTGDIFIGDYTNIVAYNSKIYPIWTKVNSSGKFEVWTAVINDDDLTDVPGEEETYAADFVLRQNYPNPFNPATVIEYTLPRVNGGEQFVSLKVYDLLGRNVATPVAEKQAPGFHSVKFNAGNLPSGVYFYALRYGNFSETKKMILMR